MPASQSPVHDEAAKQRADLLDYAVSTGRGRRLADDQGRLIRYRTLRRTGCVHARPFPHGAPGARLSYDPSSVLQRRAKPTVDFVQDDRVFRARLKYLVRADHAIG